MTYKTFRIAKASQELIESILLECGLLTDEKEVIYSSHDHFLYFPVVTMETGRVFTDEFGNQHKETAPADGIYMDIRTKNQSHIDVLSRHQSNVLTPQFLFAGEK